MRKALLFVLILFGIDSVFAVTHSMQYIYSASSGIPNFPEFVSVGLLDGEPMNYYDSKIRRMTPRQDWIPQAVDAAFWDRNTQNLMGAESVFKSGVEIIKPRFNQTGGKCCMFTTVTLTAAGCACLSDGFIYMEIPVKTTAAASYSPTEEMWSQTGLSASSCTETRMWVWVSKAQAAKQLCRHKPRASYQLRKTRLRESALTVKTLRGLRQWESDRAQLDYWKSYLTQTCTEWLKKYVSYGKSTLERTVRPEVSLLQKDPSSPVTCHTTDFFPKGIVVTWRKDGVDMHSDVEVGETLPNGDGTFQITSKLTMKPEDWKMNSYSCVVQHKSLQDDIVVLLEEKNIRTNQGGSSWGIIIGCVAAALALVAVAVGVVLWRRSRTGYGKAGTSDTDSENSSQQRPKA
nr:major histocompatibility complex class I-related gene protein-like [Paramormyrops kingsleyae]